MKTTRVAELATAGLGGFAAIKVLSSLSGAALHDRIADRQGGLDPVFVAAERKQAEEFRRDAAIFGVGAVGLLALSYYLWRIR